jgi:tRNA G37 N-methylase TrmD
MRFDIITIFPGFFAGIFEHGVVRRAIQGGLLSVAVHDLRVFTTIGIAPLTTGLLAAARAWC